MEFDVCVIGAGPAGLMACLEAAKAGAKVVVVEKNSTAGRKLLCTGRGRCNVTHEGEVRDLVKAYDRCGRFLQHSLYEFSPEDVCAFFLENRLQMKVEKQGCVFPLTDRATDIKRILEDVTRREGVEFVYGRGVETVEKNAMGFSVITSKVRINCKSVIISTGGVSWPEMGSTGDGYEFARRLGHLIVEPRAALVPLITIEKWVKKLQGVGAQDVRLSASIGGKQVVCRGAMIFTDDGVGGPAVFDLSRLITETLSRESVEVVIDFAPEYNNQQLEELIVSKCKEHPNKEIAWALVDLVPRALGITLCGMIDPEHTLRINQLSKDKRKELVGLVKEMRLEIKSTRAIREAIVTKGGVCVDEIEKTSMESKLCKGLFFAGEVMDVDGPCGGYNLQIAWSTGVLAGRASAGQILDNS